MIDRTVMRRILNYDRKYSRKLAALGIIAVVAFVAAYHEYLDHHPAFGFNLQGRIIAIDPGHGGVDGGASVGDELLEKNINLAVSHMLKKQLENLGAQVIMTRDEDVSLEKKSDLASSRYRRDLDARRDIINGSGADVFVSIHANCFRRQPSSRGAIVFYYPGSETGKKLAGNIGEAINELVYRDYLHSDSLYTKILPEDLYILRNTGITGVLVETGFITNHEERSLLQQENYQQLLSEAISQGIIKYYEKSEAMSGGGIAEALQKLMMKLAGF